MNSKEITYKLQFDLSYFYSQLWDKKYQKDFLLLEESVKNFIKTHSIKFHTFHTIEYFSLFYKNFEKIVFIYEKLQYYIFLLSFNENNENISWERQKLSMLISIFEDFLQNISRNITDKKVGDIEKMLQKNPDFPYFYVLSEWIKEVKRKKIFHQNTANADAWKAHNNEIYEYFDILNNNSCESKEKILCEKYFIFVNNRIKEAKNEGFESVFYKKMQEYWLQKESAEYISALILEKFKEIKEKDLFCKSDNVFLSFKELQELLNQFIVENKNKEIKIYLQDILEKGRVNISFNKKENRENVTVQVYWVWEFINISFLDSLQSWILLFHEFGHAYQWFLSQKQNILSFRASPFMSEVSAVYFECLFEDFISWKELSHWQSFFEEYFQRNLYNSFCILQTEQEIYKNIQNERIQSPEQLQKFLEKKWQKFLKYFLRTPQIIYSPFYMMTYIFSILVGKYVYQERSFSQYRDLISLGGSMSLEQIFQVIDINIWEKKFYEKSLNIIMYEK